MLLEPVLWMNYGMMEGHESYRSLVHLFLRAQCMQDWARLVATEALTGDWNSTVHVWTTKLHRRGSDAEAV